MTTKINYYDPKMLFEIINKNNLLEDKEISSLFQKVYEKKEFLYYSTTIVL
jgi:hypothetical protein